MDSTIISFRSVRFLSKISMFWTENMGSVGSRDELGVGGGWGWGGGVHCPKYKTVKYIVHVIFEMVMHNLFKSFL